MAKPVKLTDLVAWPATTKFTTRYLRFIANYKTHGLSVVSQALDSELVESADKLNVAPKQQETIRTN